MFTNSIDRKSFLIGLLIGIAISALIVIITQPDKPIELGLQLDLPVEPSPVIMDIDSILTANHGIGSWQTDGKDTDSISMFEEELFDIKLQETMDYFDVICHKLTDSTDAPGWYYAECHARDYTDCDLCSFIL